MALAIDASSPAVATASAVAISQTATTASFTPPANSLLVILLSSDSPSATQNVTFTVTDNLGTHLTYTQQVIANSTDSPGAGGSAAVITAPVVTSAAMTVSVTCSSSPANGSDFAMQVQVVTGGGVTPTVGANAKKNQTSGTSIAQSYTATGTGSLAFAAVSDWSATGAMTAGGTGNTAIGTPGTFAGLISYGFFRRSTADGVSGSATTVTANFGGSSTANHIAMVEILDPGGGSGPVDGGNLATFIRNIGLPKPLPFKIGMPRWVFPRFTGGKDRSTAPGAAASLVNQTASTVTTGGALTIPAAGLANLLVAVISLQSTSTTVTSVADNAGGTWTLAIGLTASSRVELWYRSAPVGAPTTITPTLSGSVANTVVVSEWANITLGVSPTTNSSTTTASPNNTGSETPVVAGDLVIGAFAVNSATARTISVGNELTKPTLPASFNTATGYVIAPDTAAEDIQWTTASAASTAGVSALFRCTSTGGPPATTPFIGWGWGVNV